MTGRWRATAALFAPIGFAALKPRTVGLTVAVWLLAPHGLVAQQQRRPAPASVEIAVAAGRIDDAEQMLYEASRRAPRDPEARSALGAFLASRGQLRVGAVLLEEARQFGGDARAIDERLLHICNWTGVWDLGTTIPGAAHVSEPQRAQLTYLSHNPLRLSGPESLVVRLEPHESAGLGRMELDIGGARVQADIDPTVEGVALPATAEVMRGVTLFGSEENETFGVAHSLAMGGMRLQNVPVRLVQDATARVGLDVIGRLQPTFDAAARTLTLHAGVATAARATPSVPQRTGAGRGSSVGDTHEAARSLPLLLGFPGVRIVPRPGAPPVPLESAAGRAALRGTRWTLDLRRGIVSTVTLPVRAPLR